MDNRTGNICMCRKCDGIVHTIRRGDTLYSISRQHNVSINDIMNANRNINIYNLRIGEQICVPSRRSNEWPRPNERPMPRENQTEFMENDAMEASIGEKKVGDLIDLDVTVKELAKILKEIDM